MGRRTFSREFKRQVARQALSGEKGMAQLCREHSLCQTVVRKWREQYRLFRELAWPEHPAKAMGRPVEPVEPAPEERIAELEAALGRAHLEIELLQRALKKGASLLGRNGK
jgi:transposase-like protein